MKLSLCLATYNEENNIHYPLDSAYDLVDEVVIVDGGSTDKTVKKAKSYGKKVKVYIEDNPAMFHINKQKAIERARGEWILQLDADEALSKELKEEIKSLLNPKSEIRNPKQYQNSNGLNSKRFENLNLENSNLFRASSFDIRISQNVAFYIPRKNFFLTRYLTKGGQYPDYTIRLYRNGYARFPCKTVHENVEVKGEIGYLQNPILHYADPDFSRFLKRWDRYTTLEAIKLLQEVKSQSRVLGTKVKSLTMFIDYFFIKPLVWFLLAYFRHRGYVDGFPGFVFALFSSIRFWAIYIKLWSLTKNETK